MTGEAFNVSTKCPEKRYSKKRQPKLPHLPSILVDGRRLELPTSALRTTGGSGPISLSGHDVSGPSPLNRSDAGRRVFAPVSAWSCTPVVHNLATKKSVPLTATPDDGTLFS
jgi:hypothetical protein